MRSALEMDKYNTAAGHLYLCLNLLLRVAKLGSATVRRRSLNLPAHLSLVALYATSGDDFLISRRRDPEIDAFFLSTSLSS